MDDTKGGVMAEKKVPVVAKRFLDFWIHVWCDGTKADLESIEGVRRVTEHEDRYHQFTVLVDPRYDMEEVREEIVARFSEPIRDVFKEE
jgi:hypothetical protein